MPTEQAIALRTRRLHLDPLRVEDAVEMVAVLGGQQLYSFIGGTPPDQAALERRYAALVRGGSADGSETWCNWVLRRAEDRTAVGTVQATVTGGGRHAEIAWIVGSRWQGHGFATEAASAMTAHLLAAGVIRVRAHIHPDHVASHRVASACGLRLTEHWHDGEQRWELRCPA